jgi:hypothetical protein
MCKVLIFVTRWLCEDQDRELQQSENDESKT